MSFVNQNYTIEKLNNEIIICEIPNGFEEDKDRNSQRKNY